MKSLFRFVLATLPVATLLTGCIDDNYDLSDIDTTSELKVNNLTIPININNVKLDNIITLSDGSKIQVYDNAYALLDNGSFHSSEIEISSVKAIAPKLPNSNISVHINNQNSAGRKSIQSLNFNLQEDRTPFSYTVDNVDPSIHKITAVETKPFALSITLNADKIASLVKNATIENLRIQFPKGLQATSSNGNYDPETGVLSVNSIKMVNNEISLTITSTAVDFTLNDAGVNANHSFHFNSEISILGGQLVVSDEALNPQDIPSEFTLTTSYTLSDLELTSFSGEIDYSVKGIDINPIDLSDIPDFLNQDGTNLFLANPQIYLSVSNPLAQYNLRYQAGLSIAALRENEPEQVFSINDPYFTINGNSERSNLLFSPTIPDKFYPGFENATHYQFSSLSNILGGNKIPNSLRVSVIEPCVPLQTVKNFKIGVNIGSVEGQWQIVAPLALKPTSTIIYSKLEDGWNDADVDAIEISALEVSAKISTDLPIEATLTGYPVGIDGQKIMNVDIEPVVIPANAKDYDVVIRVNGTIRHLDGFYFKVVVKPDSETPLGPNQTIMLNNIRARVSGSYIKKL